MKTKKSHLSDTKVARLHNGGNLLTNCREYQIEDKIDGTVSEEVKNGLSCSLVICDYGKVQEFYETLLGDKKSNKTENMAEVVFLRGISKYNAFYITKIMSILLKSAIIGFN